jgi:hypothetical protein
MKSAKMVSILQIDGLGKRYGLLPSEILQRGNTFDLYILDCALSFEHYHHKKAMNNGKDPIPDYTQDQLLNILKKGKLE